MDTNKNSYTLIYSAILVVVVAVLLAAASSLLKDKQQRNIEIELKQMILTSVHLLGELSSQSDKESYIESEYQKYIKDSSLLIQEIESPLYICEKEGGERYFVIPLRGAGLWGPIWGYISLQEDLNTVYGAIFDHKGETPGLGAEISTPQFASQFGGKRLFNESGKFISIKSAKGGVAAKEPHKFDAISGGTITSEAVEEMLFKDIREYLNSLGKSN
ncbi:MAG: NADH:ubiquinone reductase (Na(+)-transporting) subunit C [Bacteroidales bacterium]